MKRPLTAQEALDVLGFIPWSMTARVNIPSVTFQCEQELGNGVVEPGTRVVLIGEMKEEEYTTAIANIGWRKVPSPFNYRYKAVAE
jgi:hypothetical protein